MDAFGREFLPSRSMAQWKCRVCGFTQYHQVSVLRPNRTRYTTSFYACSGCTTMFLNPETFNGWHPLKCEDTAVQFPPIVTPLRQRRR
jgi:hypothetical protein